MAPPPIADVGGWARSDPARFEGFEEGWRDALARSERFAVQFARVASVRGVASLDAGGVVTSSDVDGIHWSPAGHAAFGRAVAAAVAESWG